jgi:hypothetical protein
VIGALNQLPDMLQDPTASKWCLSRQDFHVENLKRQAEKSKLAASTATFIISQPASGAALIKELT